MDSKEKGMSDMTALAILVILIFVAALLAGMAIMQIRMAGINVKDFWSFIDANQNLDKMYRFSKKFDNMTPQEQIIFLSEAEKIFNAFDKIPNMIWEDEYNKYSQVLDTYKNIKVMRWNQTQTLKK